MEAGGSITLPKDVQDIKKSGPFTPEGAKVVLEEINNKGFGSDGILKQHYDAAQGLGYKYTQAYEQQKRTSGLPMEVLRGKSGNLYDAITNPSSPHRKTRYSVKGKSKKLNITWSKKVSKYASVLERGRFGGLQGKGMFGKTTAKSGADAKTLGMTKAKRVNKTVPLPIRPVMQKDRGFLDPIVEAAVNRGMKERGLI